MLGIHSVLIGDPLPLAARGGRYTAAADALINQHTN
jgi:hypothetical protein